MNAMNPPTPIIPDNAPFTPAQRSWLNGFLAGLYGSATQAGMSRDMPAAEAEDFPWHDPALELDARLELATGRPLNRRLMAAIAQLDCGQCGYLCQTYAEALAEGRETSASLCMPGAKVTMRALKALLAEAPIIAATLVVKAAAPAGRPVSVIAVEKLTGSGSAKDVRHVVIDLAESGLFYEPGDSLSLAAPNDTALVKLCIDLMEASGDEFVACPDGIERPLHIAFANCLGIARPLDRTMELWAMAATAPDQAKTLRKLSDGDDDVEPMDADLASWLRATPGQAHLCVGVVRADRRKRVRDGTLTRLDAAFSRDQAKKIYVLDRMREHGDQLWRWLQEGGHFYVCGDVSRMAKDVDAALRAIAMRQGGLDESQAHDWIIALARQGRYLQDVYR